MSKFFKSGFIACFTQRILGKKRVLQGNTSQGAMLRNPGEVIHSGTGYITIVSPTPQGQKSAEWWVKTLQSVHLPAELGGSNVRLGASVNSSSRKFCGRNWSWTLWSILSQRSIIAKMVKSCLCQNTMLFAIKCLLTFRLKVGRKRSGPRGTAMWSAFGCRRLQGSCSVGSGANCWWVFRPLNEW